MVAAVGSAEFARTSTLYYHVAGATLRQLMQARLLLEPVLARLAAEKRNAPTVHDERAELVSGGGEAHPPEEEHDWLQVANEFHDEISDMAGNRALSLVVRSLRDIYLQRVSSALLPPAEPVGRWHQQIAQAIVSGQAEEAERSMRVHMEEFGDYTSERVPGLLDEVVDWR
jgi:DNA-binding FadR family transcriptional regulator